jgi:hypothetical protein
MVMVMMMMMVMTMMRLLVATIEFSCFDFHVFLYVMHGQIMGSKRGTHHAKALILSSLGSKLYKICVMQNRYYCETS